MRDESVIGAKSLLDWYDQHARLMPWRVPPGERMAGVVPDPYHVWLSEVMLQQTTVAAVKSYFEAFVTRWPAVTDLAAAEDEEVMRAWAGLGYYARARNLLKCARVVANDLGGVFPSTEADLLKLPGVGPYTAAAIASIAFDRRAVVLDGNVERVMARIYRVEEPLPHSKERLRSLADGLTPNRRPGDYAQAVMDLGATICTPKRPACGICPWMIGCTARVIGDAEQLPKKLPKTKKPIRVGVCFVAQHLDGSVLLEKRPDKGLLGGTLGWPGTVWAAELADVTPPLKADWQTIGEVRHTFTHFHLRMEVRVARGVLSTPEVGAWRDDVAPDDLPTVMKKAWKLALAA
ncbi:MAG: A/G-specific adenine glycosylase [Pseudomonadota bacterium]